MIAQSHEAHQELPEKLLVGALRLPRIFLLKKKG
jgi:hypothetical protein